MNEISIIGSDLAKNVSRSTAQVQTEGLRCVRS